VSKSLYITSLEGQSGKTVVALALMEQLSGRLGSVSLFRPVVYENAGSDTLIKLATDLYGLRFSPDEMYGVTAADARPLLTAGKYDELFSRILERYKSLESKSEFVIAVGTNYSSASMALEFGFNVGVARNIGSPLVPIVKGQGKDQSALVNAVRALFESLEEKKCDLFAIIVNRVEPGQKDALIANMKMILSDKPLYILSENPLLGRPTVREIANALGAKLINGDVEGLDGVVNNVKIGEREASSSPPQTGLISSWAHSLQTGLPPIPALQVLCSQEVSTWHRKYRGFLGGCAHHHYRYWLSKWTRLRQPCV
jgi:phosphate acetyltransferase